MSIFSTSIMIKNNTNKNFSPSDMLSDISIQIRYLVKEAIHNFSSTSFCFHLGPRFIFGGGAIGELYSLRPPPLDLRCLAVFEVENVCSIQSIAKHHQIMPAPNECTFSILRHESSNSGIIPKTEKEYKFH